VTDEQVGISDGTLGKSLPVCHSGLVSVIGMGYAQYRGIG